MTTQLADPRYQAPTTLTRRRATPLVRWLAGCGATAVGCAAISMAIMQLHPPADLLDPLSTPLSTYALGSDAGIFDASVLMLLAGVLAVAAALELGSSHSMGLLSRIGLGMCATGLLVVVVFPFHTTPSGQLTTTGWAHVSGAGLVFIGPPMAALALARRHRPANGCSRLPQIASWLAVATPGWLTTVLVLLTTAFGPTSALPAEQIGGMVERGLTTADMATALVLAAWAWQDCPCRAAITTAAPVGAPAMGTSTHG